MWLQEEDPELQEAFKEHCHERGEGFFFLTAEELSTLCKELKEKNPDEEKVNLAARVVFGLCHATTQRWSQIGQDFHRAFCPLCKSHGY